MTNADRPDAVCALAMTGGRFWEVDEERLAIYQDLYPEVDCRQELKKIAQWLDDNPERLSRSLSGTKRRVMSWLGRAQDKERIRRPKSPYREL